MATAELRRLVPVLNNRCLLPRESRTLYIWVFFYYHKHTPALGSTWPRRFRSESAACKLQVMKLRGARPEKKSITTSRPPAVPGTL